MSTKVNTIESLSDQQVLVDGNKYPVSEISYKIGGEEDDASGKIAAHGSHPRLIASKITEPEGHTLFLSGYQDEILFTDVEFISVGKEVSQDGVTVVIEWESEGYTYKVG